MTLRLSTLLRDQLMGEVVTITGTDILVPAGAASYESTVVNFFTAGFHPGMIVKADGFVSDENDVYSLVTKTDADGLQLTVTVADADQLVQVAATPSITIAAVPQSFKDIFTYGILAIYTGAQPATADIAPTGTLLLLITESSGAVVPGTLTNGLQWDAPVDGVLGKDGTVWSDAGLATGTAGWFRFYTNLYENSGSGCNFDGAVGTSGAELNLSSTSIVLAATTTIDEFEVTLPAA